MKFYIKFNLLFIFIFFTVLSNASIVTVQNTNDTGVGSLRNAVSTALDGDTIRFNPSLITSGNDTILLSSEILIDKDLVFKGLIDDLTRLVISADTNNRIFKVDYQDIQLVMDSMTFRNPHIPYPVIQGGFIYSTSGGNINLEISHSSILCTSTNSSYLSAIYTDADSISDIVINYSIISGYKRKGGVRASGDIGSNITIHHSEISDNNDTGVHSSSDGYSKVIVKHSSILNNKSFDNGGGIYSKGTNSSIVEIDSSVISDNDTKIIMGIGGAIYSYSDGVSYVTINGSTISGNNSSYHSGGVYSYGVDSSLVRLNDSTNVMANTSYGTAGIYSNSNSISIVELNKSTLDGNEASGAGSGGISCRSNGTALVVVDSSLVLNNKSNTVNSYGGVGGIGSNGHIWTKIIINNSTLSGNKGSEGGALATKGNNQQSFNESNISINESVISNNIATHFGGGIFVDVNAYLYSTSLLDINNSTISNNSAGSGGGIYIHDRMTSNASLIKIRNSTIEKNHATGDGGGVHLWARACSMEITESLITENISDGDGAGISIYSGEPRPEFIGDGVTIKKSTFSKNISQATGGGIYYESSSDDLPHTALITVNNSIFTENEARGGGAIGAYSVDGVSPADSSVTNVIIDSSMISYNKATGVGAGIYSGSSSYSRVEVNHTTINYNSIHPPNSTVSDAGGGIFSSGRDSSFVDIRNSTLSNNTASLEMGKGGAIYSQSYFTDWKSSVNITNSTITNNQAYDGGGVYSRGYRSFVNCSYSTICNNKAANLGGGFYSIGSNYTPYSPSLELRSNIIALNGTSNIFNDSAAIVSNGYNIFNDSTLNGANILDQFNVDSTCLNLDTLRLNEGLTKTMRPLAGSVAINRGDPLNFDPAQDTIVLGEIRDVGASESFEGSNAILSIIDTTVCLGVELFGIWYDSSQMIAETMSNIQGCDSIVGYYNLQVNHIDISQTHVEQLLDQYPSNPDSISFILLDCNNNFVPVAIDSSDFGYSLAEGEYAMVINNGQCIDTSQCFTLSKLEMEEITSLANKNIVIYPNPASEEVTVLLRTDLEGSLFLVDLSGRRLIEMGLSKQLSKMNIDISKFPAGMYFIEIVTKGQRIQTEQLMIQ